MSEQRTERSNFPTPADDSSIKQIVEYESMAECGKCHGKGITRQYANHEEVSTSPCRHCDGTGKRRQTIRAAIPLPENLHAAIREHLTNG